MQATQHNTPSAPNGQPTQPTDNRITWLQAKIEHYQGEVTRLESALVHARAVLKGHQIWLAEAQKAGER